MNASDFTWIAEHSPELSERYAGQWIAVRDAEVVGVGDTASEAADEARRRLPDGDFILEAIDHEADVIYGVA